MPRTFPAFCLSLSLALATAAAHAEPAESPKSATDRARAQFVRGTELVAEARWAEALAAFERARGFQPHAVTTFNIGACERAMGRYARAKMTFERALEENDKADGQQLSKSLLVETEGYIGEIDRLLARVEVTLVPASAAIAVDGRPLLVVSKTGKTATTIAGVRDPGAGEAPPASKFTILLDPGSHVFSMSRKGFSDAVVQKTLAPGSTAPLDLRLDLLPATLRIDSNRKGAIVSVDNRDVGPVPVDVIRPSGRHRVTVEQDGFETYEADVVVKPGELTHLRAPLKPREPLIVEEWWFWTVAGVVVTGAVVGTYFATRPEPTRPEVNGGSLGWKVPL
jgi:hypothetical protein